MLQWVKRCLNTNKTRIFTGFVLFIVYSMSNNVVTSSSSMNSLMSTGATTISQDCLSRKHGQKIVDVTEVSILCDRQIYSNDDADNDDDNRNVIYYTNKPTCLAGDLGKVSIGFSLKSELPYNSTIYMSAFSYAYGRRATIQNRTDICNNSHLGYIGQDGYYYNASDLGRSLCPLRGGGDFHYLLTTTFTVPQLTKRRDMQYTPDLVLLFYATSEQSSPIVGCVETGTLAEFSNSKRRSKRGVLALIISIFTFVATFALCLHGYSQRRRAAEIMKTNRIASMIRRYHYKNNRQRTNSGTLITTKSIDANDDDVGSSSVSLTPSLSEGRPINVGSSSTSMGPSMSSSHDRPQQSGSERSKSGRTITSTATSRRFFGRGGSAGSAGGGTGDNNGPETDFVLMQQPKDSLI